MVDGGDVATVTGLAAELRRGVVRCGGLPSWNSGQWGTPGVVGKTMMLLRWRMGVSVLARAGYGDGRGREVLGGCGGALASEGGAEKGKWSAGWSGRAQAT